MAKPSAEALIQATAALEQGLSEYEQYPQLLSVRDGCIQRFEMTMDLSWKLMNRVLREVFSSQANGAKDTIREAAKYHLIADAETWLEHYEARNLTSHTYSASTADDVFKLVPDFPLLVNDFLKRLDRVN